MPSFEGGGVEKNLIIIANYFIKKIPNITLITASKKCKDRFNNKIIFRSPNNFFWENFGRIPKYFICLFYLFKEFLKNKNFVVFCFQGNLLCIILCKILNIKIIVRPNSAPTGWVKNNFKRFIFVNILKLADELVVNSLEFKKEFKKKLNLESVCIYNPLNKKEIIKLSKRKNNKNFSNQKKLKIVSVGRLVDQKDHITLLRAVLILKKELDLEILIIGEGKNKKNLQNFIKENNLNKNVKILNYTNNPFPYIKRSNIFVLTSKFEGLPNVLLEAILLNNFIISTDCKTGPKEILDNGKGGDLIKIGDELSLSNKIKFFKKNKKLCMKKLKFAKKRLDRFDSKINLDKYLNLIKNFT